MQPAPVGGGEPSLKTATEAAAALGAPTGVEKWLVSVSGGQGPMAAAHAVAAVPSARSAFLFEHENALSQAAPAGD